MIPCGTNRVSASVASLATAPLSNGCVRQHAYIRRSCFGALSAVQCERFIASIRGARSVGCSVIGNTADPSRDAVGGVARDPVQPACDGLLDVPGTHMMVTPARIPQ